MARPQTLTDRLLLVRHKLDLSQEQLAARLGVSFATVNRWEAGKSKPQKAQMAAFERLWEEAGLDGDPADPATNGSRRRRGVHRSTVLGNKGMEQMLWDAACSIRGEQDAPKFKDYIIPLLFVKRLSDVFDDEVERLAQKFGDREAALAILDEDHSLVRFYVPVEARWAVVSGRETFEWPRGQAPKSLGEHLTTTIRAIVKHNPSLAGVIDIVDYNETRNGEREISDAALKGVIETFSDPRYRLGLRDVEPDFLGRCYEYLLRKFAEGQGQSAGEFFTPSEVGFLMAEIMRPRPGEEAYDYACGSFGLLIKLQLVSRRIDPLSKVPLKLFGQELTGSSYAIACMNRIIHDMEGEVLRGDSMRNPKFRGPDGRLKKFDIVVANPMWNQPFDTDIYENDPFERFVEHGGITSGKADWAWLQHTITAMKDNGRAAVVLDTGAVTRGSGSKNEDKERNIRLSMISSMA
jgi:type I restriction enzyme M protein